MVGPLILGIIPVFFVVLGVTLAVQTLSAPEPEFWAFVKVVEHEEVGIFGVQTEKVIKGPIEVNEPKAIKDVLDLSGYSSYKIYDCKMDTCTGEYSAEHVLANKEQMTVIVVR